MNKGIFLYRKTGLVSVQYGHCFIQGLLDVQIVERISLDVVENGCPKFALGHLRCLVRVSQRSKDEKGKGRLVCLDMVARITSKHGLVSENNCSRILINLKQKENHSA